jgi:hypothetical protein
MGESTLEDANAMFQMFRAQNIEEIAQRKPDDGERQLLARAAKIAKRAGAIARQQAKAREIELNRIEAPGQLEAQSAESNGASSREDRKAEKRARRVEKRKARKSGRAI